MKFRRIFLSIVTSLCAALWVAPASADNLTLQGSPSSWNGPSIAAYAGYGSTNAELGLGPDVTFDGIGYNGGAFSLAAAFDHQLTSAIVAGIWADYTWTGGDVTLTQFGDQISAELDDQFAIGGRVGVVAMPRVLVYGLLGYARADGTLEGGGQKFGRDFSGVAYGAGVELDLGSSLSLDVQYRITNYSRERIDVSGAGDVVTIDPDSQFARVGLKYRFLPY